MAQLLFGDILIKKGLIDESALLKGLLEQQDLTPSVARIIFEEKLLDEKQILNVMRLQFERRSEFMTACREMGLLTPMLEQAIQQGYKMRRKPIGEILVSQGVLALSDLVKTLDDYLATPVVEEAAVAPETSLNKPPLTGMGDEVVNEISLFFQEDLKTSLNNVAMHFSMMSSSELLVFQEMAGDLQIKFKRIQGVFSLFGFEKMGQFCESVSLKLTELQRQKEMPNSTQLQKMTAHFQETIEFVWKIKSKIIEGRATEAMILMAKEAEELVAINAKLTEI
jgi:hypothetical protein